MQSHLTVCKSCNQPKTADDFAQYDNGKGTGVRRQCRDCRNGRTKELRKIKNPPKPPATEKRCCDCKLTLPLEDFYLVMRESGNKTRTGRCRACTSAVTKAFRSTPEGRASKRNYRLQKEYGLTAAEYDTLIQVQGGVCAICKQPPSTIDPRTGQIKRLVIDHSHTGDCRVRGALCDSCNAGLGMFKDDPVRLHAAIAYLAKYNKPQ